MFQFLGKDSGQHVFFSTYLRTSTLVIYESVFRILSNIYDAAFLQKQLVVKRRLFSRKNPILIFLKQKCV